MMHAKKIEEAILNWIGSSMTDSRFYKLSTILSVATQNRHDPLLSDEVCSSEGRSRTGRTVP